MNNMCCIDMKLVIQRVLCSMTVGLAMNCENYGSDTLSNCRNNPHIRIEKDTENYKLSLISGGTTLLELSGQINCSSLCDICGSLPAPTSNNCRNMTACEKQVDALLNSFCAIRTQQAPIIVLGSLLGVFVIVLTAVIIGWVWTCWTIKRRERMEISSKTTTVVTDTNKRYFQNPLYEDTSSEENSTSSSVNNEAPQNPSSSATIYNTDKNKEDGPAYDVLSREKLTDRKRERVVSNLPEGEDYSRLGLCDDDIERNYRLIDTENLGSKDNT